MISILRSNDEEYLRKELKRKEELSMEALGAYATAVECMCEHVLRVCPPLIDRHGPELRSIAEQVQPDMSVEDLEKSRRRLQARVTRFGEEAGAEYETMAKDIRDILKLATSATETLQTHSEGSGEEWSRFTGQVERIASMENLHEVRANLRREVEHMSECLQAMARDNTRVVGQLRGELQSLRKRAAYAEGLAMEDPLTGLLNRRGIEVALADGSSGEDSFCIVMFDINRFKSINERYGFETGDAVLREFGRRLGKSIRAEDVAGRWTCDCFLAIMRCPLHVAIPRARQIHTKVGGRYEIGEKPDAVFMEVNSSMGVAEHRPGESAQHLMDRAGKLLLAAKSQ